jgi:hypothetical protein
MLWATLNMPCLSKVFLNSIRVMNHCDHHRSSRGVCVAHVWCMMPRSAIKSDQDGCIIRIPCVTLWKSLLDWVHGAGRRYTLL